MAAAGDHEQLAKRFDHLQHELQQQDAYNLDHRVDRVLQGLGFDKKRYQTPAKVLSGGQQNRLMLARLLVAEPDLLLLDEPSNHLDMASTQWLEDFLANSTKSLLIVSHDRYFLDRVTNRTLELFHGTVDDYKGNFSAYWQQKTERVEVQRRTYERQQEEIAKLQDFIRRHHHGQKHAQAEDRRRKLERIELVPLPRDIRTPPMGFPACQRAGDIVLRVEQLGKAFDAPLFADLSFDVLRGQRWGILGGNGTGKSTLLRCVLGLESPDHGKASLGTNVKPGYFDQKMSAMDPHTEAVEAVRPSHKEFDEPARRDLLARFGITEELVFEQIGTMSGGERNRVALAKIAAEDANFLILDEPTNHLDLWARDALERAILAFDGTVLMVSHDRYLLNRIVDHILVFQTDRVRVIEGNYNTYLQMIESYGQQVAIGPSDKDEGETKSKPAASKPSKKPKRRFPYRKVADIESDIATREQQVEQFHEQLADPAVLRDGAAVKEIQTQLKGCQDELSTLYEHWEEAVELNG